jgi:hypothetical protein
MHLVIPLISFASVAVSLEVPSWPWRYDAAFDSPACRHRTKWHPSLVLYNETPRTWTREELRNAMHIKHGNMDALLDKMQYYAWNKSSSPINIVAFGSSITAAYGGSYPAAVTELNDPLMRLTSRWKTEEGPSAQSHAENIPLSWMQTFLAFVNHTWPADYRFYNHGLGGAEPHIHLKRGCWEKVLPETVDLLVIQLMPNLTPHEVILQGILEGLLRRMWLYLLSRNQTVFPPTIFVSMNFVFNRMGHQFYLDHKTCMSARDREAWRCNATMVDFYDAHPPSELEVNASGFVDKVALHYNMSSFSLVDFIHNLYNREKRNNSGVLPRGKGLSFYQYLLEDAKHPNAGGRLLMADALTEVIVSAVEKRRQGNKALGSVGNILTPLVPEANKIPLMHCYEALTPEQVSNGAQVGIVEPINVSDNVGFHHVTKDAGKYRPGWVGQDPGSSLTMSIPLPGDVAQLSFDLSLVYLESYQHMGKARVSCIQPCTCSSEIDALNPHEKRSIPVLWFIDARVEDRSVSHCHVKVVISNQTRSTGHRFKVIEVVISKLTSFSAAVKHKHPAVGRKLALRQGWWS